MKKRIKTNLGYYYKALETDLHIYYVNYQEGDENACVKMFLKTDNILLSDNYFAYASMFEVLTDSTYTWISRNMKYNLRLHLEAEQKELNKN